MTDLNNEDNNSKFRLTSVLFVLFCTLPLALLIYVYYGMEMRSRCEDLLFDLRTRIKPQIADTSRLAVVTIGPKDVAALEGENATQLSLTSIRRVLGAVLASQPEAVGLVIPHHDVDYNSPEFAQFLNSILRDHKNVYFGTFDCNFNEPTDALMPYNVQRFPQQIFGADTLRKFKKEVIRNLPLMSFRGSKLEMSMTTQLALNYAAADYKKGIEKIVSEQVQYYNQNVAKHSTIWQPFPLPQIRLNYVLPHTFLSLRGGELTLRGSDSRLAGRIVMVGYTTFRKRDFVYREGTHVNTPWEGGLNPEIFAFPLIYVITAKLQNLLENTWLREGSLALVFLQTLFCSLVSYLVWRLAPFVAVMLLMLFIVVFVYIHSLLFAYLNLELPLADTLLFVVLATIAGAFRRAHRDSRARAYKELKVKSQKALALMQARFLNRFSFELYELNIGVAGLLSKHVSADPSSSTFVRVLSKTLNSSEELRDFLAGIKQYGRLTEHDTYQVRNGFVRLRPLLVRVVNQFEALVLNAKLELAILCEEELLAWTDELLLEPIVFNLISNAVKYSPPNGKIEISAYPLVGENDRLLIRVRDQGPGIPEEFHEKIFEKFYRVKNDQVYQIKGNGLGLYLCRYFAQKIGATVGMSSELGKGSEFSIKLDRFRD